MVLLGTRVLTCPVWDLTRVAGEVGCRWGWGTGLKQGLSSQPGGRRGRQPAAGAGGQSAVVEGGVRLGVRLREPGSPS